MSEEQPKETMIGAIASTKAGDIRLSFHQNCQLVVGLDVGEDAPLLTLSMSQSTAKEMLIVLHSIYGMEDYEVSARLTKEQYEFLRQLADEKEMNIEYVLRELIQKAIDG